MSLPNDLIPKLSGNASQGAISDPGITYNEAGVSYNDIRYTFGGFYGFASVIPLMSLVSYPIPAIIAAVDAYTGISGGPYTSIGPGFFMFITRHQ